MGLSNRAFPWVWAAVKGVAVMSQPTITSRISKWFKTGHRIDRELPLETDAANGASLTNGERGPNSAYLPATTSPSRPSFLRPWAKRDEAIGNLQRGVGALADLMTGIRENLEAQGRRQEELLKYLSHLPAALESLPEAGRIQGETLKAIHQQLAQQNGQQGKLGEILERIVQSDGERRKAVDGLRDSVENLREQDAAISDNLGAVGIAMQHVSRASETSTKVLEQMRENISARDNELRTTLARQSSRVQIMLAIAIGLSVIALAAVGVVGYLGYEAMMKVK
jgi:hypothetical protein